MIDGWCQRESSRGELRMDDHAQAHFVDHTESPACNPAVFRPQTLRETTLKNIEFHWTKNLEYSSGRGTVLARGTPTFDKRH